MLGMREIRRRIRSVNSIQQITRAMEMVAVSRLKRAEERLRSARPYAEKIQELMQSMAPSLPGIEHPLLAQREALRIAVVLITSDKGLCGAFNANIIQYAKGFLEESSGKEAKLFLIGKKGHDFFSRRPYSIEYYLPQVSRDISPQEVREISNSFMEGFEEGLYDEVYLFYTQFRTAICTAAPGSAAVPVKASARYFSRTPEIACRAVSLFSSKSLAPTSHSGRISLTARSYNFAAVCAKFRSICKRATFVSASSTETTAVIPPVIAESKSRSASSAHTGEGPEAKK